MRVLLAVLLIGIAGCGEEDNSPVDVAALRKLGAWIRQDDQGGVVEVALGRNKITDAGLVHLKGLTKLQSLVLSDTKITDAGLVHLKGLTNLQTLYLYNTQITDAGLVHLKGLINLELIGLGFCRKITDAGLVHLKGMTNLEKLILYDAKVTDAGVADLQKALPNCKITK